MNDVTQVATFNQTRIASEIIELRKQIRAEIAALEKIGESTKDVRTAINATGVYLETADGATISLFYTGRQILREVKAMPSPIMPGGLEIHLFH